jgi:selenium-binding protein 1
VQIEMSYAHRYQPRQNVVVSSNWAAPNVYQPGFDLANIKAREYGQCIHVRNSEKRELQQSIDLCDGG